MVDPMLPIAVLAAGALISLATLAHLWALQRAPLWKKALWSIALCVPYVGPVFYGALFEPLLPHRPEHKASEHPIDVSPMDGR